MKTIFQYIKTYKISASIAFMLMLVELTVELTQPLLIRKIIDDGIVEKDSHTIWLWGSIMMLLALLAFLAGISNSFFAGYAAQNFAYDLRNALFQKIQSFTMTTFLRFPSASLITRLTNDVSQVQQVFFMSLRIMLRAPLVVLGSLIMAFYVDASLAIYLGIGLPFLAIFMLMMVKKSIVQFSAVQRRVDRVNRMIQENLQAMRLVKAYLRGLYEASRFEKVANALKKDTSSALRLMEYIQPILLIVMNLAMLVILWFGAGQIQKEQTQIGDIAAIVNYTMRITGSFSMFAFIITLFSRAKASADRMEEILLIEDGVENVILHPQIEVPSKKGELVFENVSFQYPRTDRYVLKNISFTCKQGEKVAIMGATGSGKSTLLQLITNFYEVEEGRILVDGLDLKEWNVEKLRQIIGYVPQRALLFTGTIFDNITWGKTDATLEEVMTATKQAQIHDSVMHFPNSYQTRVGQKGVNLSGGQKQRLSIARAILRKPEFLLFDDSTSALDIKTESALWDALANERATMLVVTQKIQTAKDADQIILLENGVLSACGTHDELMTSSTLYQRIAQSQADLGEKSDD
ncbi:ABC transporter ATP-binding protein [Rummeliibacillus suwonensis]|uniref:ABC transporter ATP-binding protein n=1 Tax=Rummeliibacillus suwonensis TaxID=1306154 RepID=UPI001AAE5FBD|nr:ABC transporter ATP-binding protein [Rummeliibacillus suwonensis]MBO2537272.1 ABC transporter ATP-binding protein [Rummeliibacillus suwonensis]